MRLIDLTYLIRVSSILMFGPVGCVAECLAAAWEFAHVRFLARVRSQMSLQILQSGISFGTSLKLFVSNKITRINKLIFFFF